MNTRPRPGFIGGVGVEDGDGCGRVRVEQEVEEEADEEDQQSAHHPEQQNSSYIFEETATLQVVPRGEDDGREYVVEENALIESKCSRLLESLIPVVHKGEQQSRDGSHSRLVNAFHLNGNDTTTFLASIMAAAIV